MSSKVYIGRLTHDCRKEDLEKFLTGYGRIRNISLENGLAFVDFDDYRDADDAVFELNGRDLLGQRVSVQFARACKRSFGRNSRFDSRQKNWIYKSQSRPSSRSRSRSSSRSCSRSRSSRSVSKSRSTSRSPVKSALSSPPCRNSRSRSRSLNRNARSRSSGGEN